MALTLVVVARSVILAQHFDVSMLDAAARLIGAYVVVRVVVVAAAVAEAPGLAAARGQQKVVGADVVADDREQGP